MRPLIIILFLSFLSGCSSSKRVTDLTMPSLLIQYPLPAFPHPLTASEIRIEIKMLVDEQGIVRFVEILRGSGNLKWDSAAASAIKMWRYTPAKYMNIPMKLWMHQTAVVQFSQPAYLSLKELWCQTKEEADSIYIELSLGGEFNKLVLSHSTAPTRENEGSLGQVNIQQYPEQIRKALGKLNINDWTEPIKYGSWYVIFKRVSEQ